MYYFKLLFFYFCFRLGHIYSAETIYVSQRRKRRLTKINVAAYAQINWDALSIDGNNKDSGSMVSWYVCKIEAIWMWKLCVKHGFNCYP